MPQVRTDPPTRDVTLCLAGDVMCGRGIDQILPHPGDPNIHEAWATSALTYVELAEARHGPIPRRVDPAYVWGTAVEVLRSRPFDAFIANLETAVTDRGRPWPGKGIQYRMHPGNIDVLTTAGIDVVTLANNHVLDWSGPGLEQTLDALRAAGIGVAGAGVDAEAAWAPGIVEIDDRRVVVIGAGSPTSGIPPAWAASRHRRGIAFVEDLSDRSVELIARVVRAHVRPDDVVVLSLHWGPNWGHDIPEERRRFAHRVIERAGVHVVHGHSSHHPLGIEVYEGRLILHGCGDLLTDYEGISGHEEYRGDLGGLYLPRLRPGSGELQGLDIVPTRMKRFRLTRPSSADIDLLAASLDRHSRPLGARVRVAEAGRLALEW